MSKKKLAPKKCSSKCNKKTCGSKKPTAKKCNNQLPPVEVKQSKSNYFYGLIKKVLGYD